MSMPSFSHIKTIWWEDNEQGGTLFLLDQTLLPHELHYLQLHHEQEVAEAIRSLRVRGAPAIGVTAAFGMVLALARLWHERAGELSLAEAQDHVNSVGHFLLSTRPTAVNLGWAVKRMLKCTHEETDDRSSIPALWQRLYNEALTIAQEDYDACLCMGTFGEPLIAEGDTVLTHCNAGMLATAGIGTALAPIYVAHNAGKKLHVFVDETRPVLQGARLTAWELQHAGVPLTLIADNMAGSFMRQGRINVIFVGADRIAANGDVANKIGTYSLAVLARAHNIPFYVAAPTSTIDLSLTSGEEIPVEQRNPDEVTSIQGKSVAPAGVLAANPAFDITPAEHITAIITEKGVVRAPYEVSLRAIMEQSEEVCL
jgi:methylthioribose-1-phosphate isomerase